MFKIKTDAKAVGPLTMHGIIKKEELIFMFQTISQTKQPE